MGVLDGRAIVVTGAGRGLGRAYAMHAASEGARVVVNDVAAGEAERTVADIKSAGGQAVADTHSVADWDGASALIGRCVESFGALDGLVNNAGIVFMNDPGNDTEEQLRRIVEINLLGTMYCGTHAIRQMLRQGRGAIVNVTSGAHIGMSGLGAYGATKGGVASLTYSWAIDLLDKNIRVNAISPRADTNMTAHAAEFLPSVRVEATRRSDSAGASPPPEHTGPLGTFLLSDLSAGITGQLIRLEGNRLSVLQHPAIIAPFEEADTWTLENINTAFERTLSHHLQPIGLRAQQYTAPRT